MSSNDALALDAQPTLRNGSTAAADVSFAKLNSEHHAESGSQAESSRSRERKPGLAERLAGEWEKRHSGHESSTTGDRSSNGSSTPQRSKKSDGFMLDSIFTNGQHGSPEPTRRHGKKSEPNGHISIDKRGSAQHRLSGESSQRSSPLSRELSTDKPGHASQGSNSNSRTPAMDPAQLVQMALNLSESRKRHVSSSLPIPVTPAGGRRVVSALDSGYGTVKSSSSGGKRASHLSDATPGSTRASHRSTDEDERMSGADNVVYTFTPATLSRAEKARKYFELASEHRRLLEHLPPLKSDATAPENYTLQATSSPGSAHYDMNRVVSNPNHKRQLGRTYNPLQALRNRRLRNRERRPLTAPPNTWQETDRIKRWIDGVEATSNDPSYRPGRDRVRLPTFSGELEGEVERPETAKRHRRSDTVNSVITRPDNGWSIEPAELLADTYWVEKGDNKSVIEDRHGNRIFPGRSRPSVEMPRGSKEFDQGNDSNADQQSHHYESEDDEKVRSRRRNLLPIPGRLRRNYISRSPSTTSNSSDEGRKPPATRFGDTEGGDENIGPLDRHMRRMIAKEEKGELTSPELVSPDHWDHKYGQFPSSRGSVDRGHRDSHQPANGRLSVDSRGHRRSKSAEGRVGAADHVRQSMDQATQESPPSPVVAGFVPAIARSPSHNKRPSPTEHKSKRSHLPIFRSKSKDRNNVERTDFAAIEHIGKPLSPVLSADTTSEQPRSSFDSGRPQQVQRNQTADSNASSLRRFNTATTATDTSAKDSNASLPRRFLKGGRIGELMRTESSRLGDKFRGSRDRLNEPGMISDVSVAPSEVSEDDAEQLGSRRGRGEDTPERQVSPRASYEPLRQKPKYYISNLPSFKSPAGGRYRSSTIETPMSEASDPFAKQDPNQGQQAGARPYLAPPKINLPDDEGNSEPEMRDSKRLLGDNEYDRRKSVSQNNVSFAPAPEIQGRKRGAFAAGGLSKTDGRRHWSISDQAPPPPASKVTNRDVARVRALLLASGIKAQEIYTKANTGRETPLPVIAKAFETAGKPLQNVSKREEHLFATRMLSETLDTELANFEKAVQDFQIETAKNLGDQLDDLSHRASEQLTKIVNETSDEADAFNVELTTKQPQEVKRVDDAVDAMFRQRRKQFRLLRRAGFKLLEWLVLGIMWWVWFVVVVINSFKKVVVGILMVLRWLLWF
ncbi:hypothetical protein M409DRAFT_30295 [Zasmidium cellare ATCC 36951]|uniref:Uncharacterized protein n=1 Tax=Zasmidium cellare ATCC 36951 TaxID=1080233 RepID=A0A6A6BZ16_ZASCE|nr:uncharacterized protein M409DRAFT_30295 [Zasmidium cellare ATCC 36951]KAF2159288.1 hypothetical protein M409DRAFT_30295 [Zasmidium cellare ATCC 36951]